MKRLAVGLVLVTSACSEQAPSSAAPDAAVTPDAPVGRPCWPEDVGQLTPRGTLTLGPGPAAAGIDAGPFVPLGDELQVDYLLAGGWALYVDVQMNGLVPGDPTTTLSPANPRTRVTAAFVDRDVPLTEPSFCGVDYGYKPSPSGAYQMAAPAFILLRSCWRSADLIGQRIRLQGEIVDADGAYASVTKDVTLTASPYAPNDQGAPGCEAP